MALQQGSMQHSVSSATLADILERVLDKGVVIAGDIKIKLVDIELLTIQIRLLICSVDKAKEMGMDWWAFNPDLTSQAKGAGSQVADLEKRIEGLESRAAKPSQAAP